MGDNGSDRSGGRYSHIPVLLHEVVAGLRVQPGGIYVDCTVGQGGHAEKILEMSSPEGRLIGLDQDEAAVMVSARRLDRFGARVRLIHSSFVDVKQQVASVGVEHVDGVLFDLGVSSMQLREPERGFSFAVDGPLDMRMDRRCDVTAADLVNELSEAELADLIYRYGEERYARRIARGIVRARAARPLRRTPDLVDAIRASVPPTYRHGRLHYATRTFQALRIAVNKELDRLGQAIRDAADLLTVGGRLCVISFHSLEDRIAKQTIRDLSQGPEPVLRQATKKPIIPSEAEREANTRSRSAKLRIAERLPQRRYA